MKGVETALELRGEERVAKIFTLLHDFVETRDKDKVAFLEKTLGWMSEVREAFKKGDDRRTWIVDRVVELADSSKSKLDGAQMLRVSTILENLLETRGGRDAYSIFIKYLHGHLLEYAGLGGEKVEPSLLEECLSKWETASKTKDSHISLLRSSVSQGSVRYEANTPMEMNYIRVDKGGEEAYIPVIATKIQDEEGKEACIVPVPRDAQKYLKEIGYLPKDIGLILFTETKPENAKVIIPVTVEEDGKIALTEWLKRFLHKNPEYREKYLIETERGYVLNLKQLERDCMVLIVTARKDGQVCERKVLLKSYEQTLVRTRVEEIANPKDTIICEFKIESWKKRILNVEEAKDVLRTQFLIKDEKLINDLAKRLHVVMHLSELDLESTNLDADSKGRLTEFIAFLTAPDKVEQYQVRFETSLGDLVADFVLKVKYIVETKYRSGEIKEEDLESILEQLAKYKEVITYDETKGRTLILFFLGLSDSEFEKLKGEIVNTLGGYESWMRIVRSMEELKSLLKGL
ncbi:MAG: hypothetical protein QXU42_00560 [Thermoproteota archaeon]